MMSQAIATSVAVAQPGRARILVVDDETAILRFFRLALPQHEIHAVVDAEQAIRALDENRFELVFVDKNLPGMDGIELLRRARNAGQRFEAVVMSGYASLDSAIEALDLGVFRYLQKPITLEDVRCTTTQALQRALDFEQRETEFATTIDQLLQSERKRGVAERLAAIGQMAATLTHEIANPLCYLQACLDGLRTSVDAIAPLARQAIAAAATNPAAVRAATALDDVPEMLSDALDAAGRLNRLVRDVRGVSRPGDGKERVAIETVIADGLRIASLRIPPHVQVVTEPGDVPPVQADPVKLAQVVANLVVNGADAIPPTAATATVTVRARSDERWAIIEVQDTGCGIDPADRDRLFTPFFTTKAERGGTGLGLSVCSDIIEAHNGRIEVESEIGRGSCFRIRLPKVADAVPISAATQKAGPARVLWVDGDRRLLAAMLRAVGDRHRIVPAASANEALAVLQTDRRFDVVLCELHMTPMNGAQLWEEARRIDAKLAGRFVFVTGGPASPELSSFIEQTRNELLLKPISIDDLDRILRRHHTTTAGSECKVLRGSW